MSTLGSMTLTKTCYLITRTGLLREENELMRRYGKVLVAVAYATATALLAFLDDNTLSMEEWVLVVIAFFTAIMTYVVPVTPEWPWMKTVVGAMLVGLGVLVNVIIGGISQSDILEIIVAVLGAIGIGAAPATSDNGQLASP